jgi:hypothetical protein
MLGSVFSVRRGVSPRYGVLCRDITPGIISSSYLLLPLASYNLSEKWCLVARGQIPAYEDMKVRTDKSLKRTAEWLGGVFVSPPDAGQWMLRYTYLQYTGESRPPISFLLVTLIAKIGESTFRYDVDRIGLIAIAILLSKYNGNPQL